MNKAILAACAAALAGALALAGCAGAGAENGAANSAPSKQQGVKDVLQQGADAGGASASASANAARGNEGAKPAAGIDPVYSEVDFDLSGMGPDMVYATVYDMMVNPAQHEGKTVRMAGTYYHARNDVSGADYYFVIIKDAMACCAQGLEFVWGDGSHVWPGDYPEDGCEAVVTGVFETYSEGTFNYVRLANASLE